MYGPPQSCNRKAKNGSWAAPMYSAFGGVSAKQFFGIRNAEIPGVTVHSNFECLWMLAGLQCASEAEQPLEFQVVLGIIRCRARCHKRLRLPTNLWTLAGLEYASEVEQRLEFRVLIGHVRYQLG